MARIGDFVEVNPINPIVQLTQVRDAPRATTLPSALAPLVDGYLVVEGSNAAAVHGLLSALPHGGAFLLSGVYGTGKSHLLAFLGLLSEFPDARQHFARRYPQWAPLLQPLEERPFFAAYISLDEFDPTAWALESIVARELNAEANRKGFEVPTDTSARGEWLRAVWEAIRQKGFAGIALLVDELAMFLNAKSGEALNRDASFLQFLAQATKRIPLLLVGVLQRGVEDLQRLEPYALTQVRDRFQQTWVLSLAHALPLINTVLLSKHNEPLLWERLSELRKRSDWAKNFSAEELFACYPFHPLTVRCLERSIGAFFSRTRSIVTFVQSEVAQHLDAEWDELITADALLDHFYADLHAHPQLRPFAQQVLPYFQRWGEGQGTRDDVEQLVKAMLAFQVGGEEPSARTLASALMRSADDVWALLERLRTEANFVDAVKRTGSPDDAYRLDPQITVTDALRRRLTEAMQSLSGDDQRLLRFAWECRSEEWLPPPLLEPRTVQTHWQRTLRKALVTVTDLRRMTEGQIQQAVANLASPHTDECLHLFVAVPIAVEEQAVHFEKLLRALPDERFAYAIVAWLPRTPTDAEQQRWRENTAVWLLTQDLSLSESELGMKVLERVREMLSARQWETQRLMQRLYADGTLIRRMRDEGVGMRETVRTKDASIAFDALVQIAAELALPQIFPRFPAIAPRREASAQTYHALTRLILRGLPPSALDINAQRWLELVAMPMGIVAQRDGQWTVTAPSEDLTDAALRAVGNGVYYRQGETVLAKSEFGLTAELFQLLIAALLRIGLLTAKDRNGSPLLPEAIPTPLSRSVATLSPAQVLKVDEWRAIGKLLTALLNEPVPGTLTAETQQGLWMRLRGQGEAWKLMGQDVSARLTQWQREMGQSERQWQGVWERLKLSAELNSVLTQPLTAAETLRQLAAWAQERGLDEKQLSEWRNDFEAAAYFFASSAELLLAWRYLNALAATPLPDALAQTKGALLAEMQRGEGLLTRWQEWVKTFQRFRDAYADVYLSHHERVHNSDAFARLNALWQSDAVRLLSALSSLPDAPDDGREALRQLQGALTRQCLETALTLRPSLQRSPVCPRCGLALNETPTVNAVAVATAVTAALERLKTWLCADEQRERLRRYLDFAPLSDRMALERLITLTPQSDDTEWQIVAMALPLLQKALSPYAVSEADLDELCDLLNERYLTCEEAIQIVREWLSAKAPSPETRLRFRRRM